MSIFPFFRPRILVVGSAHLDVIGNFENDETVDKRGRITFSIGGTAFNIATNLALHGCRAFLYTYLDKSSFIARAIVHQVHLNRIHTKYVFRQKMLSGVELAPGGFIAHRDARTKDLVAAVTATSVDQCDFCDDPREAKRMRGAIMKAKVVAADCNVTQATLKFVIETAKQNGKTVVICGVSQSKLLRFFNLDLSPTTPVDVLISNALEFEYGCNSAMMDFAPVRALISGGAADQSAIRSLCQRLRARFLIVTSPASYAIIASSGEATLYKSPTLQPDEVVSWTGAGDAVAAAVIDSMLLATTGKEIDLREPGVATQIRTSVHDYVRRVARCAGATPGADVRFDASEGSEGVSWLARALFRIRHVLLEIFAEKLLVAVILVILLLIVIWLEPRVERRWEHVSPSIPSSPSAGKSGAAD